MKQRVLFGGDIMHTVRNIVATIAALVLLLAFVTTISGNPINELAYVVIALGIVLFLISLLANVKRHSRIQIGVLSRGEFYGVVVIIMGWLFILNSRIDSLFQMLASMK
ncbi:hypothetical protein ACFLUD_02465 [Chloroflexota bacterium]